MTTAYSCISNRTVVLYNRDFDEDLDDHPNAMNLTQEQFAEIVHALSAGFTSLRETEIYKTRTRT